ncbi:2-phosphosulfolactate phosphatase [Deinococcus sp.]|uniref:2-phosphosulfolactate phosphatase n=1 Tax=Deinococcus sp. TaxID=47478 RepID=UPI003C7CD0E5
MPLDSNFYDQAAFAVRFEWGEAAITHLAPGCEAVVIVDVLSFSTAVDVALVRGASVFPYRWRDDSAARFAQEQNALLASHERRSGNMFSLSPASLATLPEGSRLVLPSPNGATLSALARETGAAVFTACFRNAAAVAGYVRERFGTVLVVAAGERWPDNSLRPAAEDLWGAGAVISALNLPVSPEAQAAAAAFLEVRPHLPERLRACSSGRELEERGFLADLDLAAEAGVSEVAPLLGNGAYVRA